MSTPTKPHGIWRKMLIALVALIVASVAVAAWYKAHYSMAEAQALDVAGAPDAKKVLIATQSSAYKDAITARLVEHLQGRAATIKVIDISGLAQVQCENWNAIVLMHTWEIGKPPAAVPAFIDRLCDRTKLVVLTTSGQGNLKMPGIDAVTSASAMLDVNADAQELARRVDAVLAR